MDMQNKLISVIVPAYDTASTISKCLDSIIAQTYKDIEIIVVNDGSTDETRNIVLKYCDKYPQITLFDHKKNKGLFATRMTGVKKAHGEYIGFVDSDDYISRDYYRELINEAERTDADIVVAKIVQENPDGYQWIQNIYEDYNFGLKKGEEIWNSYWEQEGQLFIWHTIWNKIYSARIWKEALPSLEKLSRHLIMAEDFAFSSVLFFYTKILSSIKYSRYFYYRNENASTSLNNNPTKFAKNIGDLVNAFAFVKKFLETVNAADEVILHYNRWEALYKYFWTQNVIKSELLDRDKTRLITILNNGMTSNDIPTSPEYFYSVSTQFDGRYEDIINIILDDNTQVVSFDIFDTALLRPLYRPTDVFELLNIEYDRIRKARTEKFSVMREEAEKRIRNKLIYSTDSSAEEVNIKQIYNEMGDFFHVDKKILDKMLLKEIEIEQRFITKRESVYNLYKIALHAEKVVIFTSDMYFENNIISDLLKKNGYDSYNQLFVSCSANASKRTGKLYEKILHTYKCDSNSIVHIGDSWESDVLNARKYNLKHIFYPKTTECMSYGISDISSTHALDGYKGRNNSLVNYEFALKYLGNRTAIAIASNKLFDMPFKSYNNWSEMNCSPQFFGYFALGMHLIGFIRWMDDQKNKNKYNQLVFIARDGYLPMKAYQIFGKYNSYAIKNLKYFYTSRKAAIPCGIKHSQDIYALYEEFNGLGLEKKEIINLLLPVLDVERIQDDNLAIRIKNREDYYNFAKEVLMPAFNEKKASIFNEAIKKYFEKIFVGKCALVDIGYSGRTQELIYKMLGRNIDAFYIHKNTDECAVREVKYGFSVNSFYDFTPAITGAQRELLFSSLYPSCVGYDLDKDGIIPVFDNKTYEFPYKYLVSEIQSYALEFVENYCKNFGTLINNMHMRNMEISYPFEHMIAFPEDVDLKMFDCILFEDDMWAGKRVSLSDQWRENIKYHRLLINYKIQTAAKYAEQSEANGDDVPLTWKLYDEKGMENKSILIKMFFWLINDKKYFWQRIREKMHMI